MKIITVTFNKAINYGATLQEYALFTALKKMKHDVKILNYKDENIEDFYKIFNFNKSNFTGFIKSFFRSIFYYPINKKRILNFKKFDSIMEFTKEYKEINEQTILNEDCDVLIAGSDQIWNVDITNGLQDVYTLNFGSKEINRISYAASIGNNCIKEEYIEQFKNKLSNFNYISVREKTALKEISKIVNDKQIIVTLDPTLLITKNDWKNVMSKNEYKEKYILAYVVEDNPEYYNVVNYLSNLTGLKVIHFEHKKINKKNNKIQNVLDYKHCSGPSEFLSLIFNADYVVTTSFHATVFSIIFEKSFWTIPHKKTGSRVIDLLNNFELNNRIINDIEQFKEKKYDEEIDYKNINKKIEELRYESIKWLDNAINKR